MVSIGTAGSDKKTCRLVFIGRMVHQKRAPLVVEIARKLHRWASRQGIVLRVDMVGTGAYLDVVRHMIRRANLSDVITLHAADSDVPALPSVTGFGKLKSESRDRDLDASLQYLRFRLQGCAFHPLKT